MKLHLFSNSSDPLDLVDQSTLVVGVCSTQLTRDALTQAALSDQVLDVIGWVDISSPNLVDLLDDLINGPGGAKLSALKVNVDDDDIQRIPTQRGLATIAETGIGIRYTPELTDPGTAAYLGSIGALPLPNHAPE